MNFKLNQQIDQIHSDTVIVGIDIAKHKHIARVVDDRGKELARPLAFANTQQGFQQLLFWMKSIMKKHAKQQVLFGMEPTGHYWLNLAHFLKKHRHQIVVVNPMHVKKTKELDDNSPTKNDVKDAHVIARLVQGARYSVPHLPEGVYAELRVAMNLRDRVNQDLMRVQGRIHNWIDRYFPEFLTVFKDWQGKAAIQSLKCFPLPQDVQRLEAEQIVEIWKQEVKRAVGITRATKLLEAAKQSVGLPVGSQIAKMEIQLLLQQYELLQDQLKQLIQKLEELLDKFQAQRKCNQSQVLGWLQSLVS
jgi:transposase